MICHKFITRNAKLNQHCGERREEMPLGYKRNYTKVSVNKCWIIEAIYSQWKNDFKVGKKRVYRREKLPPKRIHYALNPQINSSSYTSQVNVMVERANGTIKNSTIKVETYQNLQELTLDLNKFLLFYLFTRRHGSQRKELGAKVRTPFDAMQSWFNIKPDEFWVYAMAKLEQCGEIWHLKIVSSSLKGLL